MCIQVAIEKCGGISALAKKLNVAPPTVMQWKKGIRKVPIKRCVEIEKLTNGEVTRKDLRPDDWHLIWTDI